MARSRFALLAFVGTLDLAGCKPSEVGRADSPALVRVDTTACFVGDVSVLARPSTALAPLRGWLRANGFAARDSGSALLVDSDGFSLDASWVGVADSVLVSGFSDFIRVELLLVRRDSVLRGTLRAHSDAALERDSTGTFREFRRGRALELRRADCSGMPLPAGRVVIDPVPNGSPRPGVRFDPSTTKPGARVGTMVLDSVTYSRTIIDSSFVGTARFRGSVELSGRTLRHPDADMGRVLTCFEADSSAAARLPRWMGDERRAWFCFENREVAARELGPPSEGVPATIVIDRFIIHRGMSDEVNSARFVRLIRGGLGAVRPP
jgi:hypothetical protein